MTNVLRPVHYGLTLVHLSRNEAGTETMCGLRSDRMATRPRPIWVGAGSKITCEVCRRLAGVGR